MGSLFKYKSINSLTDVDRIIDIIRNNRIYVPTRKQLNDPLEGASLPKVRLAYAGRWYYVAQHKIDPYVEQFLDKYRILSLSSDSRNPQMWAHYAGNYTGCCIEFSAEETFSAAQPVSYVSKKKKGLFQEFEISTDEAISKWSKLSLYEKSEGWMYESEYRILTDINQNFLHFKDGEIRSVILGHNINENIRALILSECQSKNIPVYSTWYSDEDYLIYHIDIKAIIDEVYGSGEDILNYEKEEKYKNNKL